MSDSAILARLDELERRLSAVNRWGVVAEADYHAARVRVRSGELVTGWLPWLTRRAGGDADWWAPETGEQVLVIAPGGDPAQAAVIPAAYSDHTPPPADRPTVHRIVYADGAEIEYDRAAHALRLTVPGTVTVTAATAIDLHAPVTTVHGELTVTGDVRDRLRHGDSSTMRGMRDTYNKHTHPLAGPVTTKPNDQMDGN